MLLLPRRQSLSLIASNLLTTTTPSLTEWADLICGSTPESFRRAIQETNHFLYRGAEGKDLWGVQQPKSDLLSLDTYDEDAALIYFERLEKQLSVNHRWVACPSNGHIATSNPEEAGRWGAVVSVWPLGTEWSYVWPKDQSLFWSEGGGADALVIDQNLQRALTTDKEVLFASHFQSQSFSGVSLSAFISVPQQYDETLRGVLQSRNYGL